MSAAPGIATPSAQSAGHAPWRVLHLRDSPWLDGPGRTILETAAHVDPARVDFHIGALVSKEGTHPLLAAARQVRRAPVPADARPGCRLARTSRKAPSKASRCRSRSA